MEIKGDTGSETGALLSQIRNLTDTGIETQEVASGLDAEDLEILVDGLATDDLASEDKGFAGNVVNAGIRILSLKQGS